jgi:AcrR family transcriptional regulator
MAGRADPPAAPAAQAHVDGHIAPADETRPVVPATARGEATRRRILDTAEAVFGELGYYEASVSEITRRAGVAQGTFYIYFRTKREIFVELVQDVGRRLRAASRAAIAGAPDRLEAERRGFRAFFAFVAEHREIFRIVQDAARVEPEAFRAYYLSIARAYERGLRAAMENGQVRRMDPEAIAYALIGIGHFVALRWLIWPPDEGGATQGGDLPEDAMASVLEFITAGLSSPSSG